MANEISVGLRHVPIFPCFTCQRLISPTVSNCRFCGAAVDYETAREAADLQARLNQAVNRARTLRILAGTLSLFFLLSLFVWLSSRTLLVVLAIIPALLALRWIRNGSLSSEDHDFKNVRGITLLALALWCAAAVV